MTAEIKLKGYVAGSMSDMSTFDDNWSEEEKNAYFESYNVGVTDTKEFNKVLDQLVPKVHSHVRRRVK